MAPFERITALGSLPELAGDSNMEYNTARAADVSRFRQDSAFCFHYDMTNRKSRGIEMNAAGRAKHQRILAHQHEKRTRLKNQVKM
jgi:hypothetical protein